MTDFQIGLTLWALTITVLVALVIVKLSIALQHLDRIRQVTNQTWWIIAREARDD
jgi:hypothetical protein